MSSLALLLYVSNKKWKESLYAIILMSLSNFKKQGDAAFKAGNYQAAIDEWSKAINVGGGSIEESRSLLSNR